eukprot:g5333.t1
MTTAKAKMSGENLSSDYIRNNVETLNVKTLTFLFFSVAFTVSIVILNKIILNNLDFPYPITVTACHFLTNSVFTKMLQLIGMLKVKSIPLRSIIYIALFNVSGMVLVNYSLQVNSVTVYQTFKLINIPLSAYIYVTILGRNNLSWKIFLSLIIICSGAALVIISSSVSFTTRLSSISTSQLSQVANINYLWDITPTMNDISSSNYFGLIIGFASSLAVTCSQIYAGEIMKKYELSGVEFFHLYNLPQSFFALILSVYYENDALVLLKDRIFDDFKLPLYLFVTCCIALGINILTPLIVKRTSSTTYQVVGIVKTSLVIIIGYIFFQRNHNKDSPLQMYMEFIGVGISMIGVSLYFVFKTIERQKDDEKKK